jgi:uncharacterized protein
VSNLTISVAELLGRPGQSRDIDLRVRLEAVGVSLARLDEPPVEARLTAHGVFEGILVTGRVHARGSFECARCLRPFAAPLSVEVCELFLAPGHEAPEGEEVYAVVGTEIDLEPMLVDALTLSLPLKPLCDPDCKGLCASCGADLNQGSCDCATHDVDPRWAELEQLRARLVQEPASSARA